MNMAVFWDPAPFSVVNVHDVSEVLTVSVTRTIDLKTAIFIFAAVRT
jgi:hypothetical protein